MANPTRQAETVAVQEPTNGQVKTDTDFLAELDTGPKPRERKGDTLHIMWTLQGDKARRMHGILDKLGENNISAYVRRLVMADLKARINGQ